MALRGHEHKYQLCVTRTAHRPRATEGARRVPQNGSQLSIIVMHIGHRGVTRDQNSFLEISSVPLRRNDVMIIIVVVVVVVIVVNIIFSHDKSQNAFIYFVRRKQIHLAR